MTTKSLTSFLVREEPNLLSHMPMISLSRHDQTQPGGGEEKNALAAQRERTVDFFLLLRPLKREEYPQIFFLSLVVDEQLLFLCLR